MPILAHRRGKMETVRKSWLPLVLTICLARAAAAEAPGVMVFPYQPVYGTVPDDVAARTTELVLSEMGNNDRLKAVQGPKAPEAAQAPKAEVKIDAAAIKKAVGAARTGASEVKAQNFDKAVKILKDAIGVLEANAEYLDEYATLVDAYINLSVAYLASGEEDACDEMISRAVRLEPARQLDPKEYVPLYIRMFHARRTAMWKQPRGSLIVTTSPAGAAIVFDGKQVGATPAVLKEIFKGEHYLKVEKAGEPARYKRVAIVGGAQAEAKFEGPSQGLGGAEGAVAQAVKSNKLDQAMRAQIAAAGQKAGADYVVLGGVTRADTVYQVNSYLMKVKTQEMTPLVTLFFDLDLLGASIEVYKMVEEIAKRVETFPEPLRQQVVLVVPGIMKADERPAEIVIGPVGAAPALPAMAEVPEEPAPAPAPAPAPVVAAPAPVPAQPAPAAPAPAQPAKPAPAPAPVAAQPTPPPAQPAPAAKAPPPSLQPKQDTGSLGLSREGRKLSGQQQIDPSIVIVEHPKRWYENPWIWTAVGVVLVGAGIGTYFYIAGMAPNHGEVVMTWPK
jgi:hypothetical protein